MSGDVQTIHLADVDVEQLRDEDALERESINPMPPRFGYAHEVDYSLENSGNWSIIDQGRVWRLRLESQEAISINLIFSDFYMPDSANLFVYNDEKSEVLGAFTSLNNKQYGKFSIQPITVSAVTLEYFEPKEVRRQG